MSDLNHVVINLLLSGFGRVFDIVTNVTGGNGQDLRVRRGTQKTSKSPTNKSIHLSP
jgi:hypothetical protein